MVCWNILVPRTHDPFGLRQASLAVDDSETKETHACGRKSFENTFLKYKPTKTYIHPPKFRTRLILVKSLSNINFSEIFNVWNFYSTQ